MLNKTYFTIIAVCFWNDKYLWKKNIKCIEREIAKQCVALTVPLLFNNNRIKK